MVPHVRIPVGPDGALWVAAQDLIGRVTTAGTVTTYSDPRLDYATAITAGPDGALWFTDRFTNSIGRITTTGVISIYTNPSISEPNGITAGPDGALWFTNTGNNSIGRITTSGVTSKLRLHRRPPTGRHHRRPRRGGV